MKQTQTIPHSPIVPVATPIVRTRPRALSEHVTTTLILLIALAQGLLYLMLVPPWQHYDEPTHFEYAWLVAHSNSLPTLGDQDPVLRRELAASMIEYRFFQRATDITAPDLTSDRDPWIGTSELGHPPAYYILVSLPLRLAAHLDITSQLYIARAVSLLLLLVTVAAGAGLMRDLTPDGHSLRWAVPLAIALLPPFVDLMTAVNSDAGAVAVFSLFLWGATRAIRFGLSWRRVAWLFGTALLAVATKNTASVALLLVPFVCLLAFWVRRGWRWRGLLVSGIGIAAAMLIALVSWGDAADWYRGADVVSQDATTRLETPSAPFGSHAIMLETPAGVGARHLVNPLLPRDINRLAGHTITVGGWLWADRAATVSAPCLVYQTPDMSMAVTADHLIQLTTTPTFVSWTFAAPQRTYLLSYAIYAAAPAAGEPPLQVFLDGALIVDGIYPTSAPPAFDDPTAHSGTWDGRRFTNLLRNASGEQSWPRLRPWFDHALGRYAHRSPSQLANALFDLPRVAPAMLPYMVRPAVDGMVDTFGWGHVRLADPIWLTLAGYLAICALLGILKWTLVSRGDAHPALRPALLLLALAALLVWANTVFRPLPLLGGIYVVPAARYTFPAISVTMLAIVGGWWALWPHKFRRYATLGLISLLFVLNGVAISTIAAFYQSLPLS
jgi:hypothetical protein